MITVEADELIQSEAKVVQEATNKKQLIYYFEPSNFIDTEKKSKISLTFHSYL